MNWHDRARAQRLGPPYPRIARVNGVWPPAVIAFFNRVTEAEARAQRHAEQFMRREAERDEAERLMNPQDLHRALVGRGVPRDVALNRQFARLEQLRRREIERRARALREAQEQLNPHREYALSVWHLDDE